MRHVLFCVAAVSCDIATTYTIVGALGGEELNPLIAVAISMGWFYFMLVKYGVGFLVPLWYDTLSDSKRMLLVSGWLHFLIALVNSLSLVVYNLSHSA